MLKAGATATFNSLPSTAAAAYGRRNLVETTIGRYKHLIGPKLRARSLQGQQGEAAIAVATLNKMIRVEKPMIVRTA
jgi:hypothetical protein